VTGGSDSTRDDARAEQGRVLVAAAVAQTRAPPALRERLEADRERARRVRRRRHGLRVAAGGLAAGLAALAVALIAAPSGDEAPTVGAVVRLGDRPAAQPPPGPGPRPGTLRASVGGVVFPDWDDLEWPATGARADEVAGRATRTVFYRTRAGGRAAYTIVDGEPLDAPAGGRVHTVDGVGYRVLRDPRETAVVWEEGGHTCVLSAPAGVPVDVLVEFAAWEAPA
jgi:hypothetical protein